MVIIWYVMESNFKREHTQVLPIGTKIRKEGILEVSHNKTRKPSI
jgi:hypothetical protein